MLDFDRFEAVSFDCYGTLIDWESGIVDAVKPVLAANGFALSDAEILKLHAEAEPRAQQGEYVAYREVLRRVMRGIAEKLEFVPSQSDLDCLADSLGAWPAFSDTVDALSALKSRYRLVILSNIDDDLFGLTAPRLGVEFNDVVTAEQARSYKPSLRNFELMIERLGIDRDRLLHVAGSMFHDVAPAKEFGLSSVWVNRHGDSGSEATWPTEGDPDLQAPDLATLVSLMGLR